MRLKSFWTVKNSVTEMQQYGNVNNNTLYSLRKLIYVFLAFFKYNVNIYERV